MPAHRRRRGYTAPDQQRGVARPQEAPQGTVWTRSLTAEICNAAQPTLAFFAPLLQDPKTTAQRSQAPGSGTALIGCLHL